MFKKRNKKKAESDYKYELACIMNDRVPFAVREAVNHLCINIMCLRKNDGCQSFVFTSAGAREGKTATSASVARALAVMNDTAKILYVDADLRASGISAFMNEEKGSLRGLSEYLSGEDNDINVVSTDLNNLHIVCSGAKSNNPLALLNSPKMSAFVETCKRIYDYIIFDSSPVGIVTDALLLADYIDGYIITTKADQSKIADVNEAVSRIRGVNGKVLGVVLGSVAVKAPRSQKKKNNLAEIERLYSVE